MLIGLHPSLTQIRCCLTVRPPISRGAPKALVQSAAGGDAIVSGRGGSIPMGRTRAPRPCSGRPVRIRWSSDVKFQGGHGTQPVRRDALQSLCNAECLSPTPIQPSAGVASIPAYGSPTAAAAPSRTCGVRTPTPIRASTSPDTQTPGRVLQASVEHLPVPRRSAPESRSANREFLAPRGRPRRSEGEGEAISARWRSATRTDILVANYHGLSRHPDAPPGARRGEDLQLA
ncbi:hypothetical protein ACRAWD_27090 [Caulobacter segnis]